jgi:hypothetical protein
MGGIIGDEQIVEINGKLYKYIIAGWTPAKQKHLDQLRSGERTDIPNWLYEN